MTCRRSVCASQSSPPRKGFSPSRRRGAQRFSEAGEPSSAGSSAARGWRSSTQGEWMTREVFLGEACTSIGSFHSEAAWSRGSPPWKPQHGMDISKYTRAQVGSRLGCCTGSMLSKHASRRRRKLNYSRGRQDALRCVCVCVSNGCCWGHAHLRCRVSLLIHVCFVPCSAWLLLPNSVAQSPSSKHRGHVGVPSERKVPEGHQGLFLCQDTHGCSSGG